MHSPLSTAGRISLGHCRSTTSSLPAWLMGQEVGRGPINNSLKTTFSKPCLGGYTISLVHYITTMQAFSLVLKRHKAGCLAPSLKSTSFFHRLKKLSEVVKRVKRITP